jgi:hypothetical protein
MTAPPEWLRSASRRRGSTSNGRALSRRQRLCVREACNSPASGTQQRARGASASASGTQQWRNRAGKSTLSHQSQRPGAQTAEPGLKSPHPSMIVTEQHRHDGRVNDRRDRIVLGLSASPHMRARGSRRSALHPVNPHGARWDLVEPMLAGAQSQTVTRRCARGPPLAGVSRRVATPATPLPTGTPVGQSYRRSSEAGLAHSESGASSAVQFLWNRHGRAGGDGARWPDRGESQCRIEGWRTLARFSRERTTQGSCRTADQEVAATVAQALGRCHQIMSTSTRAWERRCPFTGRPGPPRRRLRCRSLLPGFVA